MKKTILIVAALLMVFSGVAAVSAYEAHVINVTAHVENALTVSTDAADFGTVFPQESFSYHRSIALSTSAVAELGDGATELLEVNYQIFAETKLIPEGTDPYPSPVVEGFDGFDYYTWMHFLKVGLNGGTPLLVGPYSALSYPGAHILTGINGTLDAGNLSDMLDIILDVPVFEGSYNAITDLMIGMPVPTIIPASTPGFDPNGMDFGIDLKIQVTSIVRN